MSHLTNDISLCRNEDCKIKNKCRRYTTPANQLHQSYIVEENGECEMFLKE